MLKHLSKMLHRPRFQKRKKAYGKAKRGIYEQDSFDFIQLVQDWDFVVGEKLAKNTAPLRIFNKQLIVLTSHAIYSNQLSFLSIAIIRKINEQFPSLIGKISKLSYQTSNDHFKKKNLSPDQIMKKDLESQSRDTETLHPYSPKFLKLQSEAEDKFGDIQDHELKDLIKKLYVKTIHDK
jgi:hypothetical protein